MGNLEEIRLYRFNVEEYSLQDIWNMMVRYREKFNSELPRDCSLMEQYEYFNIKNEKGLYWSKYVVDEKIKENIKSILLKGNKEKLLGQVTRCRRKLLILGQNDIALKILQLNEVFETIVNKADSYLNESFSKEQIEKIFELLSYYHIRNKNMYGDIYEYCKVIHQNDIKIVNAVVRINNILPNMKLDIDNIQDKTNLDSIFERLESSIIVYGTDRFYRQLLKKMWECYDENEKMFDFRNNYELILLYHLSIKLITNHADFDIKDLGNCSVDEIYDLTRSLVDLLNVGNENKMKFLFVNNPVQYILDILEHSAIYDIHQYNVNGILYFCEKILRSNEKKVIDKFKMNVDDFMYITKKIIENVEKYRSNKFVMIQSSTSDTWYHLKELLQY